MKCPNCGYTHETKAAKHYKNIRQLLLKSYNIIDNSNPLWMTATKIARNIGIKKPSVADTRAIGKFFREIY